MSELFLDLAVVQSRYELLGSQLPQLEIAYAVKANPHPAVLSRLARLGASFDVASVGELLAVLDLGVTADRIEYSHPIKAEDDLRVAYENGVRRFTFDAAEELTKLARLCPGSRVLARINVDHRGAAWPLADKFGADLPDVLDLLGQASDAGLHPAGVTFHVGSQQRNPGTYAAALQRARQVFRAAAETGLALDEINIGGGLPSYAGTDNPPRLTYYTEAILDELSQFDVPVHLVAEPGRFLVADAGTLSAKVIGTASRAGQRWAYLDAGVYHGLTETGQLGTAFTCDATGDPVPTVLAGPTCDSVDVLFDREPQNLPADLSAGDTVQFHGVGAYCVGMGTRFNGFPSPGVRILNW